jgi:hypothetical protein
MRRAALVIGVDRVGDLPPLRAAAAGAERVAAWLRGEGYEVRCLTDRDGGEVRREQVSDALFELVTVPPRYGMLVVYFSGHGAWQARSDIWLLSRAPARPDEAINLTAAMDLARSSGIPNVVFVSDACRTLPADRAQAQVLGGAVFPNHADLDDTASIDVFRAAGEARAAYELREGDDAYSALTAALLSAYREPEPQMVRTVTIAGAEVEVVPNRKLEDYLRRKVDALLAGTRPRVYQSIRVSVPSADDVYMGRVRRAPPDRLREPPAAPWPEPVRVDEGRAAAVAVRRALSRGARSSRQAEARRLDRAVKERLSTPYAAVQTGETGFVLRGAALRDARLLDARDAWRIEAATPQHLRVQHALSPQPPAVCSLLLRLDDDRSVLLAVLPGFIGHLAFDARGLMHLGYVRPGAENAEADLFRARVALAIEHDTFRLRSRREAQAFADRAMPLRTVDPALAVYAAHAYRQAGDAHGLERVLGCSRNTVDADLFDVRLLAHRRPQPEDARYPLVPLAPMLTQAWNFLDTREIAMPTPLRALRGDLCDALWTTFTPAGTARLLAMLEQGEIRACAS